MVIRDDQLYLSKQNKKQKNKKTKTKGKEIRKQTNQKKSILMKVHWPNP